MPRLSYTTLQVDEAIRHILEPAHLASQLLESGAPITTPMPDLNTPTKLLGGSGIILTHAHEFSYDVPGDHFVFDRPGAVDVPFVFSSSQSFSQDASVAVLTVRLHINGVAIPGVYVKRTISNANTIGVVGMSGHFTLNDGDYLELWAESTKTGDFDAWSFNSELKEDPA